MPSSCTAEQFGTLMRNAWRYARIGDAHVRIHPPTSDVSVLPPGPVRYVATIEVLDCDAAPWGLVEQEANAAVAAIFREDLRISVGSRRRHHEKKTPA